MNLAKREAINYWRSNDLRRFLIASTTQTSLLKRRLRELCVSPFQGLYSGL